MPLSYELPPSSDGGKGLNNNSSALAEPAPQPYSAKAEEVVGAANLPLKREATDTTSTPSETSETSQTSQTDWTDVLGRKLGEALCPEWFDEAELAEIKRPMGTYSFLSMYQQRPVPAEGALFKKAWFQIVDRAPSSTRWKRGYDLGLSGKPGCDFTATAKVGYDHDGNLYIDGVIRKRMEYPEQRRVILGLIRSEPNIEHIIEESANGHAVLQDLRREPEARGARLRGIRVKEGKIARTFGWQALAEDGRVFLIRGRWNDDFIEEACTFPNGPHDDQIDAVSLAVKHFAERPRQNLWAF